MHGTVRNHNSKLVLDLCVALRVPYLVSYNNTFPEVMNICHIKGQHCGWTYG